MAHSEEIIDRIVAGVLEQLRPRVADDARRDGSRADAKGGAAIEVADDVITAAMLESRLTGSRTIVIGTKSVLTPSAREFLAKQKIDWSRGTSASGAAAVHCAWLAIVARSTPAVAAALGAVANGSRSTWTREVAGSHREAAQRAVAALCRAEFDGVVVFTGRPEAVACRVNRNSTVRGAAVATIAQVKAVRKHAGPNLFAVRPSDATAFELRNLLREIISGGKPAAPADWSE